MVKILLTYNRFKEIQKFIQVQNLCVSVSFEIKKKISIDCFVTNFLQNFAYEFPLTIFLTI